jgi:hypothetical protein
MQWPQDFPQAKFREKFENILLCICELCLMKLEMYSKGYCAKIKNQQKQNFVDFVVKFSLKKYLAQLCLLKLFETTPTLVVIFFFFIPLLGMGRVHLTYRVSYLIRSSNMIVMLLYNQMPPLPAIRKSVNIPFFIP